MLPGVLRSEPFLETFKTLTKGTVCAIAALSGEAPNFKVSKPLAVGLCEMSAADVSASNEHGKFISVIHVTDDKLT